ncbi:peptidase inhibitor family I36 protein [Streptomyces roseoverticillatus]|uniref:peptidase inhibitor family I36 protein n=1 Tax=Streptomyces roseoverticillatus TaxID=66429 RepID=UPI001F1BD349|nr:peptidase inhibitor family I36 protein [Streptomyces roseoverticillatus]
MRTIRIRTVAATVTASAALALLCAPTAGAAAVGGRERLGPCAAGQLCLWTKTDFRGTRSTSELADIGIEDCVTLPAGGSAASLANRTGRPVTAYQSATCGETGEFTTYPSGTWVPESPYVVRAYKVWEH